MLIKIPQNCWFCKRWLCAQYPVCWYCYQQLPFLKHACQHCANPKISDHTECGYCVINPPPVTKTVSVFVYQHPINHLITQLKFQDKLRYAQCLAVLLSKKVRKSYIKEVLPPCILPLPLHPKRLKQRGFNQSLILAKQVAKHLGILINTRSCLRIKYHAPQATLKQKQRCSHIKKAFALSQPIQNSHVAIVDDVITTGSTIYDMARCLLRSGVQRVDAWSVARTQINP